MSKLVKKKRAKKTVESLVDEIYRDRFRESFFSHILPLIGRLRIVRDAIYLPLHPVFIKGIDSNRNEIERHFIVQSPESTFMDMVRQQVSLLRDTANACAHAMKENMKTSTGVIEARKWIKLSRKGKPKDDLNTTGEVMNTANAVKSNDDLNTAREARSGENKKKKRKKRKSASGKSKERKNPRK